MGKSASDQVTPRAAAHEPNRPDPSIADLQSEARQTRLRLAAAVDALDLRVQTWFQQQRAALGGFRHGSDVAQAPSRVAMEPSKSVHGGGSLATMIAAWTTIRRVRALWRSHTSSLAPSHKTWLAGAMMVVAAVIQARRQSHE